MLLTSLTLKKSLHNLRKVQSPQGNRNKKKDCRRWKTHKHSYHLIFTNFTKHSLNSRRILRPFLGSNRYMCNPLTNVPRTGLDVDEIVKYTRPTIARLDNKRKVYWI